MVFMNSVSRLRRGRLATCAVSLAVVLSAALPPVTGAQGVPDPDDDPFYAAPKRLTSAEPGDVLRSREVELGINGAGAAWQLLYRTTDAKGDPEAAVTTVTLPSSPAADLPLVS